MEKELAPIRIAPDEYREVEACILDILRKEIYHPLLVAISFPTNTIQNSQDDLLDALTKGRVTFSRGVFTGRFTAVISRELQKLGAEWDANRSGWALSRTKLPVEVKNAISIGNVRFQELLGKVDSLLSKTLSSKVEDLLKIQGQYKKRVIKTDAQVRKTMESITVQPKISPEHATRIASDYTKNLDLYIQKFSQEETEKLRKKVKQQAFKGYRYEGLVKEIQKSYGVTKNKAKFLARQETNLLMVKVKELRYTDAGVNEYKWVCVHSPKDRTPKQHTPGNVRYYHGLLDGKKFTWNEPPVVNSKGDRKNPGQDYNCRCTARPIVKF